MLSTCCFYKNIGVLLFISIRDQAHELWAEGSSETKLSTKEIFENIKNVGFLASNIDIFYDEMMSVWRFTADIKPDT